MAPRAHDRQKKAEGNKGEHIACGIQHEGAVAQNIAVMPETPDFPKKYEVVALVRIDPPLPAERLGKKEKVTEPLDG